MKALLEVDKKPDEYEVAIVEPGVDEQYHERTKAVDVRATSSTSKVT